MDELRARSESRIKVGKQIFTAVADSSIKGVVVEELRNRVKAIQADINACMDLPWKG